MIDAEMLIYQLQCGSSGITNIELSFPTVTQLNVCEYDNTRFLTNLLFVKILWNQTVTLLHWTTLNYVSQVLHLYMEETTYQSFSLNAASRQNDWIRQILFYRNKF
jgi:hypothetical protein